MQISEVEAILRDLAAKDPSEIDGAVATEQLEKCFVVLRREIGFKQIQPGEAVPILSYELVQAKDSVETALTAVAALDVAAALDHCRTALSDVQRAVRRYV